MIRATYNRDRRYYSLGYSTSPENWNDILGRYERKRLTEEERKANLLFDRYSDRLNELREYFTKVEFTFDRFVSKMFNTASGAVLEYFDTVISELEAEGRLGSVSTHKDTKSRLKAFNKKDFTFQDVDKKFLQRFETFLSKTCSQSTIGIYLRTLRAVYNRAITDNLVKREAYPFTDFKIKAVKARKKALTKDQLETLKKFKAKGRAKGSLNLFLFSYYARGMNLADIASLKWDDIRNGRIYYQRRKTADQIDLLIDSNLAKIIGKYKGDSFIFGILEEGLPLKTARYRIKGALKKINQDLKAIALETGLPEDITFYWGRHSYATALKRGGVPISVIQETLGHSSEQVTKNYLDSFETSQLDKIGELL